MLHLASVSLEFEQGSPFARHALRGISLGIAAGDRLGLCGPSGAGKSSLLLLAAGLCAPSAGRISRRPGVRIGLVLQEPETALFARTVREEVAFAPRRLGLKAGEVETAVVKAMTEVGLTADLLGMDPFHLAPAQRRLVALAAVLSGAPDLLLLDEPTVGLPPAARERLLGLIKELPGAVVIAAHDLDLLWRTCARVALLDRGRLIFEGGWCDLTAHPEPLSAAGLTLPAPLQTMAALAGRGWPLADPGHDEESVAAAIVAGGPGGHRGEGRG